MAGGRQNTQRGQRPQSQRGDITGNKDAQLRQEHAEVLETRREELGQIGAQVQRIKDEGVVDLMSGAPKLEHPTLSPDGDALIDAAAREPQLLQPEAQVPEEGVKLDGGGKSTYDVFELPQERPQAALQVGEVLTPDMSLEPVIIRAEYDLEDITIGYGNTHTFRAGMRYRVPRWVAAHLEEKNLITVLQFVNA